MAAIMNYRNVDGIEGIVEDIHGNGRNMPRALEHMADYRRNAPTFEPSRRRFIRDAAMFAALLSLPSGCATTEKVEYKGKVIEGWQAQLAKGHPIYGPPVHLHMAYNYPMDFEGHKRNTGRGGYDYSVEKVPVVTALRGRVGQFSTIVGGLAFFIYYSFNGIHYQFRYGHLASYVGEYRQEMRLGKVIGISGNTGRPSEKNPTLPMPYHLHIDISIINNNGRILEFLDPQTFGLHDRLVYWDPRAEFTTGHRIARNLKFFDTLPKRLAESELDSQTKSDLLGMMRSGGRDSIIVPKMKEYFVRRVLQNNEFGIPSTMFSLAQEFLSMNQTERLIAILPFPHYSTEIADWFRKNNPEAGI